MEGDVCGLVYDPRWRFLKRHATEDEWIVVVMLRPGSIFAHEVFVGTFAECVELLGEIKIPAY
jgi:hypothetical protein